LQTIIQTTFVVKIRKYSDQNEKPLTWPRKTARQPNAFSEPDTKFESP